MPAFQNLLTSRYMRSLSIVFMETTCDTSACAQLWACTSGLPLTPIGAKRAVASYTMPSRHVVSPCRTIECNRMQTSAVAMRVILLPRRSGPARVKSASWGEAAGRVLRCAGTRSLRFTRALKCGACSAVLPASGRALIQRGSLNRSCCLTKYPQLKQLLRPLTWFDIGDPVMLWEML